MLEYNVPQEVAEQFREIMEPYSTPINENTATEITNAVSAIWDLLGQNGTVEVQKVAFSEDSVALEEVENATRDGIGQMLANDGNTAFLISNDKGATLCLSYTKVGDQGYFQWLSPENARVIQESQMEALQKVGLEASKELTLGQKILNAFSMFFRHRPIEAVARREAYLNFYENAQRAAENASILTNYGELRKENLTTLHNQRVQEEQERLRQQELEKQRQMELEKQRQMELEKQRQMELEKQRQMELEKQQAEQRRQNIDKLEKDIPVLSSKIQSMEKKYNENAKKVKEEENKVKQTENEYTKMQKVSAEYTKNKATVENQQKSIQSEYYDLKNRGEDFETLTNRQALLANWKSFHKNNEENLKAANRNLALKQTAFDVLGLDAKTVYIEPEVYLQNMLDKGKEAREKELLERNDPLEKESARFQKLIDDGNKRLGTLRQEREKMGFWSSSRAQRHQKDGEIGELETQLEDYQRQQEMTKNQIERNNKEFMDSMTQLMNETQTMSPAEKKQYAWTLVLAMRHRYEDALDELNKAKAEQEKVQKLYNDSQDAITQYQGEIDHYVNKGTKELTPEEKARFQDLSKIWTNNVKWLAEGKKISDTFKKHSGTLHNNVYYAKKNFNEKILAPHNKMGEEIKTAKQQLQGMQNNLNQLKGEPSAQQQMQQPEAQPKPQAPSIGMS